MNSKMKSFLGLKDAMPAPAPEKAKAAGLNPETVVIDEVSAPEPVAEKPKKKKTDDG